jgi:hypothetical protein
MTMNHFKATSTWLLLALCVGIPSRLAAQHRADPDFPVGASPQVPLPMATPVPVRPPPAATPLLHRLQEASDASSPNAGDYIMGMAGAVGAGVLVGGALGYLGYQLGDPDAQENVPGIVGSIALGGLGYSVGSVLGAHAVGSLRHPKDSMKSTWIGGLVGMLAGTAIGFAQPGDNLNGAWLSAALLAPPVGAVIGFFR